MVVVYLEADDIAAAFKMAGTSDEPFDRWFRDHVTDVHRVDLAEESPPPEHVLDFRVDSAT